MIRRYITLLFVFSGLCFGCTEDDGVESDFEGEEILLTAGFESDSRVSASAFDANDRIGVFVTKYNGDDATALLPSGNYVDNHLFTANGKNISTEKALYYPASGNVDIFGYHPYTEQVNSIEAYAFPVGTDQGTLAKLKACDFVWAKRTNVAPNNSVVNLTFRHLMSKVSVSIEAGQEIDDLTGLEVKICGISVNAVVNLSEGKVSLADTKKAEIVPLETFGVSGAPVLKKSYQAIIAPQVLDEGMLLIEATLNGKKYTYWTGAGGQIFGAGKEQSYKLIINAYQREMLLKSTTVTNWTSNGSEVNADVLPDVDGRDVLMALYNATGGDQWTNKANWGSQEIENWYGVTVEDKDVVAIDLSNNNLKGKIPAELFYLTKLKKLRLDRNQLFDTIPATLGRIATLEELNLSRNQLSGQMPKEIGQLGSLNTLVLRNNKLSGNVPKWVSWLNCYQADSVARQYNAAGQEIMLEVEGMGQEGEKYIGDVTFTSQAELNTFAAKGYTEILGSLTIADGGDIKNIPSFTGLKKIHGTLSLKSLAIEDFSAFEDLEYIGVDLLIKPDSYQRVGIKELIGGKSLEYIGGNISVDAFYLEKVGGFENLKHVNYVDVYSPVLIEFSGFNNISKMGRLTIAPSDVYNPTPKTSLVRVSGFDNLQEIIRIEIKGESALKQIPEFNNLKIINQINLRNIGVEKISGFTNLLGDTCASINIVAPNLTELSAFEQISAISSLSIETPNLVNMPKFNNLKVVRVLSLEVAVPIIDGFANLEEVEDFYLSGSMQEINGFNKLQKMDFVSAKVPSWIEIDGGGLPVGGTNYCEFYISDCNRLTRISGFCLLTEGGRLNIINNNLLTSISGFDKLEGVTKLRLENLPSLKEIPEFNSLTAIHNGGCHIINTGLKDIAGFANLLRSTEIQYNVPYGCFVFSDNKELENISGFGLVCNDNMGQFTRFTLTNNPKLKDVTGFVSIGKTNLKIENCHSLQAMSGFVNCSMGDITIKNCYSLTVFPLFKGFVDPYSTVTMESNTALEDYTNLKLIINENTRVVISKNKYNPTKEDILAGKVKPE